jgi:bifunctional oligoribonuclease and PAP phosphatase NrnA
VNPPSSPTALDLQAGRVPYLCAGVPEEEWQRAAAAIDAAEEICLACHVCPDGDALGSMLAVAHALLARNQPGVPLAPGPARPTLPGGAPTLPGGAPTLPGGAPTLPGGASTPSGPARPTREYITRELYAPRVIASFGDDPPHVPENLRFLPGLDLISSPHDFPREPQVMITFDAASSGRLGLLTPHAARARDLIVLDHHASNTRFGTIHLVDPEAAATAVLSCELIDRLAVTLSRPMALGLYAGLVTDTGSFKYASTKVGVHKLAARLLATGIDPEAVARELWDRAPFGYLRVLSAALGRAVLEPRQVGGMGLVWTAVPKGDRAAHGVEYDMLEPVIDVVRRTLEAEVAIVFKQDDAGAWQVSARSKGNVDVGSVCTRLGGGGHAAAAGFTSPLPVEETIQRLRQLLDAASESPGGP